MDEKKCFKFRTRVLILFLLTILLSSIPLLAQKDQIRFKRITIEDGLSQSSANCILQDRKGFIWIGTQDGLNLYFGHRFTHFKYIPGSQNCLSDNNVTAIYEDSTGILWIGTYSGGLNRLDTARRQFSVFHHDPKDSDSLADDHINSICSDQQGNLWIGTQTGLDCFDHQRDRFIHFRYISEDSGSISGDQINSLFTDRSGNIWVGTLNGINRIDPESMKIKHFRHQPGDSTSLSHNNIRCLFMDGNGILWIGTWSDGLNQFNPQTNQFAHFRRDSKDLSSLGDNRVYSILEDSSGVIWVGTLGGGISFFDPNSKNFDTYQSNPLNPNSLSGNDVRAICEDDSGILWLGTYSGLNRLDLDTGRFLHFRHDPQNPNSLSSNLVYTICLDDSGFVWVGTQGGGLNRFGQDSNAFYKYKHDPNNPESLSDNRVNIVFRDSMDVVWVGTWNGLSYFNPALNGFVHFRNDPEDLKSLSDDDVREIYEDRNGGIWIGTRNGGINLFDRNTQTFRRFEHDPEKPDSLSDNRVFCIQEDHSGFIWIGTRGGGLNRFDPSTGRFSSYTESDGLPNNVVYGILEDEEGDLWISTNNGLVEFNPKKETFRVFDFSDGLQSNEFNFGAYHKNESGKMYFGGIGGLNVFSPNDIKDNPFIPPIVLIDFQVFNKSVPVGERKGKEPTLKKFISYLDSIELLHKDNMISFEFAALHYTYPEKNEYAYILEGVDKEWNYVGNRKFATYTHIPPGDFTFRVKGTNHDGVWNEEGTSINIKVKPPLGMTWAFRIFALGVVLSLALALYKARTYTIKKRNRELEFHVRQKTSELNAVNKNLRWEIEERKQLVQSAQHSATRNALLYEVGRRLSEVLKLEELLRTVVNSIMKAFNYYGVMLFLVDEGSTYLKLNAVTGAYLGTCPEDLSVPFGKGMIGQAALSGKTQISGSVETHPHFYRYAYEATESELTVPIKTGKKVIGVLDIQSDRPDAFDESDLEAMEILSSQIATAIENARLYTQAHQEIEERRKAEKEIEKKQIYLKSVLENTPNAIVTTDSSGRIVEWNPGAEKIFGYSSREALGKDIDTLITKDDVIDEAKKWTRLTASGKNVLSQETIRYRKNGSPVQVIVAGSPIRIGDELHGNVAVYTDITNQKKTEAALQKAKEEAQSASRAKSEFLANMSHEIRTPMNGILGMTELALGTELNGEQKEYLQAVKISAESLMNIINDILDFSKVEAKKIEIESHPFNLRDALHSTLSPLAIQADRKGLELVYHISPDVAEIVVGDPGRLRQIITNLVGNAVKFTKEGDVLLSVREERRDKKGSTLHFSVEDTGIGIAEDKQKEIFNPFEQVDGSTSRSFYGTGLGLAITSQLVKLMGGKLALKSRLGVGSIFYFSLPFGIQKTLDNGRKPAKLEDIRNLPVLVVDDNSTNRRILFEMLKNWSMIPTAVESGKRALEKLEKAYKEEKPYKLVILDANMPEMDGFKLAKRIKQNKKFSNTMIMMLSSAGMRGDAARCRKLGVTAYLTKPIKQSSLLESIQVVMGYEPGDKSIMSPFVTRHSLHKPAKGYRILLAEDNPINQKLVVRMLEKDGFTVAVASNGEQVVSLYEKENCNLILMDIQMPKMDGFSATSQIREKENETGRRHIPIVALTAHAMKGDRERCIQTGMDGYISKPIKRDELLNTISQILFDSPV